MTCMILDAILTGGLRDAQDAEYVQAAEMFKMRKMSSVLNMSAFLRCGIGL